MLVRVRDFADMNRINVRTVQIHIKENAEELYGHVERRGKQGTWLDEFAVNFLLNKIQLPTKDEIVTPSPREAALMEQLNQVYKQLAIAEREARENAEKAGKIQLLEETSREQKEKLQALELANHDLTLQNGSLTATNDLLVKTLEGERSTSQKLSDELTEAKESLEQLKERNEMTETNLKTVQDRLGVIQGKWWYKWFGGKKTEE